MNNQPHQFMKLIKKTFILLTGTLILSLIGLYNGYPLVYSDTGTYIYSGFDKFIPMDRPVSYGLFLWFFSFEYSAWFVIIFQNLITAFVIYEFLKIFPVKKKSSDRIFLVILLFLTLFTGIGWYSNQLMPDFFAPLIVFIIFTLIAGKQISVYSFISLSVILVFALTTHFSHLLIGSVLVILVVISRLIFRKILKEISFRRIFLISAFVFSGWFVLPLINYFVEKQFILSKGSHVFLMAHLDDTGILKKFLNEYCGDEQYKDCKLCRYKDSLPPDLASFIWSSGIVENTGGWVNSKEEYKKIISATIKKPKYLALNIYRSVTYGFVQLTRNEIGQGLSAYNEGSAPYGQIHWRFNNELNNYLTSRQNLWNGVTLKMNSLNFVFLILLFISLFFALLLFTSKLIMQINFYTLAFLFFGLMAIVVNSFVTAGLNSPCERFQARVVWILPLSIILIVLLNYDLIIKSVKSNKGTE
jgi:hypothetical protein